MYLLFLLFDDIKISVDICRLDLFSLWTSEISTSDNNLETSNVCDTKECVDNFENKGEINKDGKSWLIKSFDHISNNKFEYTVILLIIVFGVVLYNYPIMVDNFDAVQADYEYLKRLYYIADNWKDAEGMVKFANAKYFEDPCMRAEYMQAISERLYDYEEFFVEQEIPYEYYE